MANGLFLTDAQSTKIERYLIHLHSRAQAICTLLADISGQLISAVGMAPGTAAVTLAALAASNMAATAEMARLVGEPDSFSYLFHEGKERNIYITAMGDTFLLVILFDRSSQIGWVRLLAKKTAMELLDVVDEIREAEEPPDMVVDADFGEALASQLDQAFEAWD
jgi:predicted regulator of Ras-like GTPase activity (Roadblock/LC7/MglB family)